MPSADRKRSQSEESVNISDSLSPVELVGVNDSYKKECKTDYSDTKLKPSTPKKKRTTGTSSKPSTPGKGSWTAEEDMEIIMELFDGKLPSFKTESQRKLAQKLGRSEDAVKYHFFSVIKPRLLGQMGLQDS